MVVLDTCALLELCKTNVNLTGKTLRLIEKGAFLLSISLAEIACKVRLGKLEIAISPSKLYQEILQIENMTIVDIGVEEWLDSIDLAWPDNKDPADRLIVSFAMKRDLAVVTSDEKMKKYYKKCIWKSV